MSNFWIDFLHILIRITGEEEWESPHKDPSLESQAEITSRNALNTVNENSETQFNYRKNTGDTSIPKSNRQF
jgi:hypothetical protein